MSLLDLLPEKEVWERFYEYKTSLVCPKAFAEELRAFIDEGGYLPVAEAIARGDRFPLPRKAVLNKLDSRKRRVVYVYPKAENTVLKLLTWLLLRRYDGLFSPNLYSFRPGRTARDAVRRLTRAGGIRGMWSYKADISNYFNSIPIPKLTPLLAGALGEDPGLLRFLCALLEEPEVLEKGQPIVEEKGIMAGTPLSAFYANLYLGELDRHFEEQGVLYARYSDDIILFAGSEEEREAHAAFLRDFLEKQGLRLNPEKEVFTAPGEGWTFLGFRYRDAVIDVAPATLRKLKQKMRRKARALRRWAQRGDHTGEQAAKAFLRVFKRKLLESPGDNELSWSRWFFPLITTTGSLRVIDRYAQDCLRFLLSGTRTKGRYNVRYGDLKALGYRSLVHEYYASLEASEEASGKTSGEEN
ncbi:MAG: group II intron reverse transcriptase domain-containing protein [Oscillospiraceae bacterium]|nr:group II intron reverse transcriptase domain-containing protein [Oscillospiraceae bacterium]